MGIEERIKEPGWQDKADESLKALAEAHTILDELVGPFPEATATEDPPLSCQADAVSQRLDQIYRQAFSCTKRLGILRERF